MVFGIGEKGVNIIITAVDKFSDTFNKASEKMSGLKGALGGVGSTIKGVGVGLGIVTAAATGAGVAVNSLVGASGKADAIRQSFMNMAGPMEKAPALLEKLKEATKGTVSEMELMQSANQAMLLGIDQNMLPEMFSGALAAAQATGRPVSSAIEDITTGIGRQSKLILDNLGIMVKQEEAEEKYAESIGKTTAELTDQEKKMAFMNATMDALRANQAKIGDIGESAAIKQQKLTAQFDNMKIAIGTALTPAFEGLATQLTALFANQDFMNMFNSGLQMLVQLLQPIIQFLGKFAQLIMQIGKEHGPELQKLFNKLVPILEKIFTLFLSLVELLNKAGIFDLLILALNIVASVILKIVDGVQWLVDLLSKAVSIIKKLGSGVWNAISKLFTSKIKTEEVKQYQTGGYVPETGLAMLHQGEMVIPAHEVKGGYGMVVNIENIYGVDPRQISQALQERLNALIKV